MPSANQGPADAQQGSSRIAADDTFSRAMAGFGKLIELITPWLLDLGSWISGALIAFNLLILGALLTVGPGDHAVLAATAAVALALPPGVAGFFLLRLAADMKSVDLEEVATTAFQQVGFTSGDGAPALGTPESGEKRRMRVVLRYSYALLALTLLLTVIGVTAALWHMAWWIAVLFVAMVVISQGLLLRAIAATGSNRIWRTPAGADEPGNALRASKKSKR